MVASRKQYQSLSECSNEPPSELDRFNLKVNQFEIVFSAINAYINSGVGIPIIAMNVLWFVTTPVKMVGLGVTAGVTAATAVTAGVGALIALVAFPIAYFAYQEATEAANLVDVIKQEEEKRKKERKKLFSELLRLRNACQNKEEFHKAISNISTISSEKLENLVNDYYDKRTDPNDQGFDKKLQDCFEDTFELQVSFKEAAWRITGGILGGVGAAGVVFGSSWAVAAVVAGFGLALAAAVPVVGWAILGLTAVALIGFGIGISYTRYKNAKREILRDELKQENILLKEMRKDCKKKIILDQKPSNSIALDKIKSQSQVNKVSFSCYSSVTNFFGLLFCCRKVSHKKNDELTLQSQPLKSKKL